MRPLYSPLLCLFSWARAIGLATTPALPALFCPNPPGSGSLYVGQAQAKGSAADDFFKVEQVVNGVDAAGPLEESGCKMTWPA